MGLKYNNLLESTKYLLLNNYFEKNYNNRETERDFN